MDDDNVQLACINCGRSEMEIPLVSVRYSGEQIWTCSQCMPILIHKPEQLIGKLKGADRIPPAPHHH